MTRKWTKPLATALVALGLVAFPAFASAGTVTVTPTGPGDVTVTLTPAPTGNGVFTGWTGACTGTGSCVLTGDAVVGATFETPPPPVGPPVASFDAPTGVVPGTPVNFTSTSTCPATPCTFRWRHGTTTFGTGPTAAFTYASAGTKTVTLDVTDVQARVSTVSVSFTANAAPPPPPPPPPTGTYTQDNLSNSNPVAVWGEVSNWPLANNPSLVQRIATGGPTGGPYWRATLPANAASNGSRRTEIGYNEWRNGIIGKNGGAANATFMLYKQGEKWRTVSYYRFPAGFNLGHSAWQPILQMKQTQPAYDAGGRSPILAIEARQNQFQLHSMGTIGSGRFQAPATIGPWYRLTMDVFYHPDNGTVAVTVERLNPDGTVAQTTTSPTIAMPTMMKEVCCGSSAFPVGSAITSHLRKGLYRDSSLGGGSIDVGATEVYALP